MGYFAGFNSSDYYIRSYTPAAVAAAISGQTMNINGSSTSCSGNSATATTASLVGINTNRTDAAYYQIMWTTSGSTTTYSTGNTTVLSSTYGGIGFYGSAWTLTGNPSYGVACNTGFYVGAVYCTGNVTAYYSDERFKTKVGIIENALDKVCSLDAFLYVENDLAKSFGYNNKKQQVALSAQQVQKVQPEAVELAPCDATRETTDDEFVSKSGENYLTIDYAKLIPLLVEAIKELRAEIVELKKN